MVQAGTADGLKTGHTEAGGFDLVASSLREGRRLIMVVNGLEIHARTRPGIRTHDELGFANFTRT